MPHRAFERAVADGFVRSAKFGSMRQAARLYLVRDVDNFLMAVATGREPKRVAGMVR